MLQGSYLKEALCLAQGMARQNYLDLVREQNNGKRKKEKRANYTTYVKMICIVVFVLTDFKFKSCIRA